MKGTRLKKCVVMTLSACMIANSIPLSGFTVQAAVQELVDFTDEQSRGGWRKTNHANGTISFADGSGEDGYMLVKSDGDTIFADTDSVKRADGFVEMDLTLSEITIGARLAVIFRYNSPTDWEGIGFDSGQWIWCKGDGSWGNPITSAQSFTARGEHHKIRVEYRGTNIRVFQDDTEIINQTIDKFTTETPGNIGLRLWGIASEDRSSAFQVDNVRTGELGQEAAITPSGFELSSEEAGKNDLTVRLAEKGPKLTAIKNGSEVLSESDYFVDGQVVTIRKEYIAKLNQQKLSNTKLSFEFEDGQKKVCVINISIPETEIFYEKDLTLPETGTDVFCNKSGNGTAVRTETGILLQNNGLFIDENSASLKNQEVEFWFNPLNYNCHYGVVLRYRSPEDYIYVGPAEQRNQHFTNWAVYGPNGNRLAEIPDAGFILAGRETPYKVKVRAVENVITVFVDNEEIYNGEIGNMTMSAGKMGFRTTANTGMTIQKFTQQNAQAPKVVQETAEQTISSDKMEVRVDARFPRVIGYSLKNTEQKVKGQELAIHQIEINNKLYTPEVEAEISGASARYHLSVEELGISFDTVLEVNENVLSLRIENVKEMKDVQLYTLNFPQHSLVSMSENEPNAKLTTNDYRGNSSVSISSQQPSKAYKETTLAVLSNDHVAAAMTGESYKNRHEVAYQTFEADGHKSTGLWLNEYTYRGLDGEVMIEKPWAAVSVTGDRNSDGRIDVQDGAIALRDDCMKRKVGADIVTDTWTMIAMNVGSEAQYPFLRILDNVKKMSLATDGFGQNIIIKGYQSEGHDASHPDFTNYNQHAGGLEDFNVLLEEAKKYNARIGIHVNHTDVYPESPQFGKIASKDAPAWSWYDSAKMIVRENDDLDKSEKGLDARFQKLYETDTKKQIDTTYVDVFFGTRWPMYKLVENIAGRGIALGTEYSDEMVSHSVFAHGIQINSQAFEGVGNLVRFIENDQSDIFYQSALFRGVKNRNNGGDAKGGAGINGWQQSSGGTNPASLYEALNTFYCEVLPGKFLAQYPLMKYDTADEATLGRHLEVVTRVTDGVNIITKDGYEVAHGTKIFIPWEKDGDAEGKIYHYNKNGGSSTWHLPKSWGTDIRKVTMYRLSAEGKTDKKILDVSDGQVTIDAEKMTGYVIYKSEAEKIETAGTMEWSTGSPVKDMGFDSYNFEEWTPSSSDQSTGHIVIRDNELGNAHLYIEGTKDGKVTQELTGLVPGQTYSASVWCTTSDGRKASIEVINGEETVSNYMDRSNVRYGIHHNDKYLTNAQRMQVRFTAAAEKAVLTLSAEKAADRSSKVEFDDVRVMKVKKSAVPKKDNYIYWEDFENVDQGFGLFVSPESDQSHLSQKNPQDPVYTPDVIDGEYSLKVRAGDYMRTIPSSVRFQPNRKYKVGISYKSPDANAFTFAVKSDKAGETLVSKTAVNQEGKLVLEFTTGEFDDYYIDVTSIAKEYYLDNLYVEEARAINRETLGQLIEEAEAFAEENYTPESYQGLKEAVGVAKTVKNDDSAAAKQIEDAYHALDEAIKNLVPYASDADKEKLRGMIAKMEQLPEEDYHPDENWLAFQAKIAEAKKAAASSELTQKEAEQLLLELLAAKDALMPKVDRSKLKAIMAKAAEVDKNAVEDGAKLGSFLSAIEAANAADMKPGVKEAEIEKAVKELTDAYAEIVLKEDYKNAYIAADLESIDEADETYFFEKDWAEIKDAKSKLLAMKEQKPVLVKSYYEIREQLERAFENRLPNPLIPDSVEIDPAEYVGRVTATNTQPSNAERTEGPVEFAFDKKMNTIWHSLYNNYQVSEENPAVITIDLGREYQINQLTCLPRQNGQNGIITKYNLYVKTAADGSWTKVQGVPGTFEATKDLKKVKFDAVKARFVKIEVTEGVNNFASAAEFGIYQKASDFSELQRIMAAADKINKALYLKEYTTEIDAAYKEAETLLQDVTAQQSKIDAVRTELERAMDELAKLATKEDMKVLDSIVESARKIDLTQYQNTGAFEAALKKAEALELRYAQKERIEHLPVAEAAENLASEQKKLLAGTVQMPFKDVQAEDYFYKAVLWAVENDIVKGYGDTGKFMPDAPCTRANVVTYLWREAGSPEPQGKKETSFSDLSDPEQYYYKAVLWAAENDIVKGYGTTGKFMPDAPCTRANIVTFLWRANGEQESGQKLEFSDVDEGSYYYRALQWAFEHGIVEGYGNTGKFMPDNTCTRANTVTFLHRNQETN